MSYTNDPSDGRQTLESLAQEHAQIQSDLSKCRCPQCQLFGIVSDTHDYFGAIYRYNCLPVFWVINPETGDGRYANRRRHRIEEVR